MGQERNIVTELVHAPANGDRRVAQGTPVNAFTNESEDYFAQFFTRSLDLLCVAGLDDGYFKQLNPAWTTRLGWSIEELLAKPFLDFVHPGDLERTLEVVATLADGSEAIFFENRYRHQDGSYRWLQWNARPVPRQQRVYATARDITQRKRHEREILEIVDRERGRLGREMHDGLCQTLAGIAALSATLSRKLTANRDVIDAAHADEINKLLQAAIGDARDMARGLDPIGVDAAGLDGALRTLAVNVEHLFGIMCRFECHCGSARPHREVKTHLFRIAQEAVNNVAAHARAETIVIGLSCDDNQGTLSIRDDGVGLPADSRYAQGMGLHTMAYRARLIDASLEVRQHDDGGTLVTCNFPLPASV